MRGSSVIIEHTSFLKNTFAGLFVLFHFIHRSSTMCVVSAGFTSCFNGLVVFTLLGFMAKQTGRTVQEVASESGK